MIFFYISSFLFSIDRGRVIGPFGSHDERVGRPASEPLLVLFIVFASVIFFLLAFDAMIWR